MWFTLGGILGILLARRGQRIGRVFPGYGALFAGFLFGIIFFGVPLWVVFKVILGIGL